MKTIRLLLFAAAVASSIPSAWASDRGNEHADGESRDFLQWARLLDLPPAPGKSRQVGLAGPFVGTHNGALIVAGGANFPDAPPWEGGKKVWWDDVFVLQKDARGKYTWRTNPKWKLPKPLAYGASIGTKEGIVCIGGCDAERCYKEVFCLEWRPEKNVVEVKRMPSLPRPLAFMAGALVGETIFVAGGQETTKGAVATKHFWSLDLSQRDDPSAFVWREFPAWPGPARILPVAAGQSDGSVDCFYLFSGREISPQRASEMLTDAYRYNPQTGRWRRLTDVARKGTKPVCVMGASGLAFGANHILIFGGDDGKIFLERERLEREIGESGESAAKAELQRRLREVNITHPGFGKDILAYHTITDTWMNIGELPTSSHVTTTAVRWDKSVVIPTGEIRPGIRTPKVWKATAKVERRFGWFNYSVLGVYMSLLVAMGFYFSRREKSTNDFFKAGGRIPWWAAGMSIFGTQLSALTFMAIPAKTFATDWRYFMGNMAIVMAAPFIIFFFLPFYRRLNITTAYEYLEKRFNLATRLVASVMFILFQFGRIGIVLFLPSLALSAVTGMDVRACILVMGFLCILYSVLGGIEAVIWTDVIQVVVLFGGALLCLVLIAFRIPGGWNAMCDIADSAGKLRVLDFRFDFTSATFWVFLLGGIGANLISYGTDQTVIQRYLTTRDERSAAKGIWTNAILTIPATFLFFGIGTALFAFFRTHPQHLHPTLENPDAIFPLYIVTQLPAGVAGLLIAGVFAAAMSSLDSSMNSVSAAVTTDFYRRFRPDAPDQNCLALARWVTVVIGGLGTGFALVMARWDVKSLWDQFATLLGLFGGGLGGVFLLAVFTRRTHGIGALAGLLGSGALQFVLRQAQPLHSWAYAATGIASCFAIGYVVSLLVPAKGLPPDGLTIYTIGKAGGPE